MQKKVEKVFIAKDISRTADLSGFPESSSNNLAEGEILVLDKYKNILSAGATVSDSDVIYIVEGLSSTFDYTDPSGSSITGVRQLLTSDPIQGIAVTNWRAKSYTAATEAVATLSGSLTPVVGEEYTLRLVFTDVEEHPGQFTKTYSYIAETTTLADLYTALASAINSDSYSRVTAVATTTPDVLTLTAKTYGDNETVDNVNEYKQVVFKAFLKSDNFDSVVITYTVDPSAGFGTWRLVRDEEKWSQGYEGILNRTLFPIQVPTFRTVLDETYDCLLINHKNWFTNADGRQEQVDITTKIYIPVPASSNQGTDILAVLNPWMASLPQAFNNVSI